MSDLAEDKLFISKSPIVKPILFNPNIKHKNNNVLLVNNENLKLLDTRKYKQNNSAENNINDIPNVIKVIFSENYNIIYIDDIIRKKLKQEKNISISKLKNQYKILEEKNRQPQTHLFRDITIKQMKDIDIEINNIENDIKMNIYNNSVKDIIAEYRKYNGTIQKFYFDNICSDINDNSKKDKNYHKRISLIEKYLDIANNYITLDIVKVNECKENICNGCGISLSNEIISDEGTIRCKSCYTEHDIIITHKNYKDVDHNNVKYSNSTDDSIDNFIKTFMKYQGLQPNHLPETIYDDLDNYFANLGRPLGDEIKNLPLNNRGRRGDTNHKMLWKALSELGYSEYYEDANLIGHIYWGWTLPKLMQYKEQIINHYNMTQKVFYCIPIEERCRNSSLGTNYRLWRHLQLVGYECYIDEFKIANNYDSLRIHNKLWKLMCEGCDDPDIYYIPS